MENVNISQNGSGIRLINRQNSPKRGGSSDIDSIPYLQELGVEIVNKKQPIQFSKNINEHIHRWAPYVQGFSASFVQSQLDQYKDHYEDPVIYDPFAGCGTVLVQSKLNGLKSYGTELNPLLQYIAQAKLETWDIKPRYLMTLFESLPNDIKASPPNFLKTNDHFNAGVLENLEFIKGGIESYNPRTAKQRKGLDLLRMAFSSILIECSNLKRSPCLGYVKNKNVSESMPHELMGKRIANIAEDLSIIQSYFKQYIDTVGKVYLGNSADISHKNKYDLVITSPPYMNGMDYVINYKIEMGWLSFADKHQELKNIKDSMVVCDNVSKGLIRDFSKNIDSYSNEWLEEIKRDIKASIDKRGSYRRMDMPNIVHKYFDDMYKIMKNVKSAINSGGRFILVVGDSLIADTYLPTDLLIAKIGLDLGFEIEKLEKARARRSGQIRSYRLRETIITLKKPNNILL